MPSPPPLIWNLGNIWGVGFHSERCVPPWPEIEKNLYTQSYMHALDSKHGDLYCEKRIFSDCPVAHLKQFFFRTFFDRIVNVGGSHLQAFCLSLRKVGAVDILFPVGVFVCILLMIW